MNNSKQKYYSKTAFVGDKCLRYACKLSFKKFVQTFWENVPGAGQLIWNWHMDVICDELQVVAERVFANKPKLYDLICNVPPGTSKSSLASILFQAWTWTRMPGARHICGSHGADLALDLSNKCRDVVRSDLYRRLFPEVQIDDSQDAKAHFRLTAGGERFICTVGGKSPVGRHALFQCIDDPISPTEVISELCLQEARDFFTKELVGRKTNRDVAVTILIMQRLGVGDPTDFMLEVARREGAAPIRLICLPAELTEDVHPPELKERYTNGLLDEIRLPKHVLARERAAMGEHTFFTQFLQKASVPGGSMFLAEWMNNRKKAAPYNCKRIRYWDRGGSSKETACATAGVLMAKDEDGRVYIEDVVNVRLEPVDRNKKIRSVALADRARYGPKYEPKIYIEMEGGSSGRDAWMAIALALRGFPVREDRVTGSKDVRAEPWAWALSSGVVTLIDNGEKDGQGQAKWDINGYIEQHTRFRKTPGGRVGRAVDQIDATSGAYNLLCGNKSQGGLRTYNLGKSRNGPPIKIFLATREQLAEAHILNPTILVSIQDPKPDGQQGELFPDELPPHALASLTNSVILHFADLDLYDKETNENWDTPDSDTGKSPSQLAINKDQAKKMWSVLLRKYSTAPQVVMVQGEDDGRHASVAMAICEGLGFKKDYALFSLEGEDNRHKGDPPNKYVYDVIKDARRMIVT